MSGNTAVKRATNIAQLPKTAPSRSLWGDAFYRLIRNRGAIIGIVIIVSLLIVSIFAPTFAPKNYDVAVLADNSAVPEWIARAFPTMIPRSEGGYVTISDQYPLGADKLGRDMLSRLIYGARISL